MRLNPVAMHRPDRPAFTAIALLQGLLVIGMLAALPACAEPRPDAAAPAPAAATRVGGTDAAGTDSAADTLDVQTLVLDCPDGFRFTAQVTAEQARIYLPDTTVALPHVAAASGARYGDARFTFWTKGLQALLETPVGAHRECTNDRVEAVWEAARLRGAEVRAVGNEPGWTLEVYPDTLALALDYGTRHLSFSPIEEQRDPAAGVVTYEAHRGDQNLRVTVREEPCADTMIEETYPLSVFVELNERSLRGCGRAFR